MGSLQFTDDLIQMGIISMQMMNSSDAPKSIQEFCTDFMINETKPLQASNVTFCPPVYDGFLCWAPAPADSRPSRRCPAESLDATQFAYRYCQKDGHWENKTDYDLCLEQDAYQAGIYFTGYTISLVSLCISLGIFLYYRILRCLRNHIHVNLIIAFLIRSLAYFVYYSYALLRPADEKHLICIAVHSFMYFALLSDHIWMVMEGLYLFLIILCTFRVEKLKFWHFGLMGWGSSALLFATYCIVMSVFHPDKCWGSISNPAITWIVNGPIIASLVANTLFLIFIIYSLVIKVRATQRYRPTASLTDARDATIATEYQKALKALLVLFPLLGIGYILFLIPPHPSPEVTKIYNYINAVMISTQGFFVALIYCFLNSEVRSVVRTQCTNWEQTRSFMRHRPCSMYAASVAGHPRRHSRTAQLFLSTDQRGPDGPPKNESQLSIPLCRRQRQRRSTGGERDFAETSLQPPVVNGTETSKPL